MMFLFQFLSFGIEASDNGRELDHAQLHQKIQIRKQSEGNPAELEQSLKYRDSL